MGTGATLKVGASNSEFNKAMKNMVSDMKNVKSEFTLASTQAKLFGTATDQLKAKQTELTSKLSIQNNMLKNQENQLKTLAQNADNLKTKQSDLASKIEATTAKYKESITETGKDSEASKALKDELNSLNESYAKLDKSIENNNSKMNTVTQKMNSTKTSLLENNKALEETNNKLKTSSLDEFATKAEKVSTRTGDMANKLAPASTAIAGLGVASATASVQFEDSMAKVFTIADESEVSYGDMKKSIMDLSSQTGISANEIADNVYEAISAGQSTGDAVNFVSNATKLAKAGFTDSASSLDVLTTIMNSYGLEASEVGNVSDKLIQTQNLGKVTVNELSADMGKLIPTAKSVGANLDEVGTGYALMTSKGIKSAEATTYMNSMMNELGKSGTIASDALKEMSGSTFQELLSKGMSLGDILGLMDTKAKESGKSLADMFGSAEASKAGMILSTNSGEDFNAMLGQMANSAGATNIAFEKMDNTSGSKLTKSFNDLKNAGINMGDTLAPVISSVTQGFKNLTTWLSSLSEGQLKAIATAGAFVIGLTAILKIISTVTAGVSSLITVGKNVSKAFTFIKEIQTLGLTAKLPGLASALTSVTGVAKTLFSTVTTFFMANPILAGITIAIGVIVLLYTKCEWFRKGVNSIGIWLKDFFTVTLPQAFNGVVEWFKSLPAKASALWEGIKGKFDQVVNFFKNNWKEILLLIVNPFSGAFALLYKNNDTFRQKTNEFILAIKNFFVNGWNSIVNFFTVSIPAWINNVVQWFAELPNKIAYGLGSLVGLLATWGVSVWNYFSTNVPIWINNIVTFFSELPGKIWAFLEKCVTDLGTWGTNTMTWISTNVSEWINNIVTFFSELPGKIWNAFVEVNTKFALWTIDVASWISTNVSQWITNIVNFFAELPNKIWTWLVNCVTNITTWGSDMLTKAKEGMTKVYNGIVDTFTDLPSKMLEIGENLVKGMWEGIKDTGGWLLDQISDFCDSIIDSFMEGFDEHSPSRIMRDLVGVNIVKGVGVGIELETPNLENDINNSMASITSKLKSTVDLNTYSASSTGKITKDSTGVTTNLINKILDKMDILADALDISIDGQSILSYTSNNLAISSKRVR